MRAMVLKLFVISVFQACPSFPPWLTTPNTAFCVRQHDISSFQECTTLVGTRHLRFLMRRARESRRSEQQILFSGSMAVQTPKLWQGPTSAIVWLPCCLTLEPSVPQPNTRGSSRANRVILPSRGIPRNVIFFRGRES